MLLGCRRLSQLHWLSACWQAYWHGWPVRQKVSLPLAKPVICLRSSRKQISWVCRKISCWFRAWLLHSWACCSWLCLPYKVSIRFCHSWQLSFTWLCICWCSLVQSHCVIGWRKPVVRSVSVRVATVWCGLSAALVFAVHCLPSYWVLFRPVKFLQVTIPFGLPCWLSALSWW